MTNAYIENMASALGWGDTAEALASSLAVHEAMSIVKVLQSEGCDMAAGKILGAMLEANDHLFATVKTSEDRRVVLSVYEETFDSWLGYAVFDGFNLEEVTRMYSLVPDEVEEGPTPYYSR